MNTDFAFIKPFPTKAKPIEQCIKLRRKSREDWEFEEPHKYDGFLLFLSFLATAVIGYVLTNHVALIHV